MPAPCVVSLGEISSAYLLLTIKPRNLCCLNILIYRFEAKDRKRRGKRDENINLKLKRGKESNVGVKPRWEKLYGQELI